MAPPSSSPEKYLLYSKSLKLRRPRYLVDNLLLAFSDYSQLSQIIGPPSGRPASLLQSEKIQISYLAIPLTPILLQTRARGMVRYKIQFSNFVIAPLSTCVFRFGMTTRKLFSTNSYLFSTRFARGHSYLGILRAKLAGSCL